MLYAALEVARYIISRCFKAGKPISNLKLQKMIYFILVDFYKKTGRRLFMEDVCAWQLGPVVPEVYYEYCSYAGMSINAAYFPEIKEEDQTLLDGIIDKYIDVPVYELVDRTHKKGTAWYEIYQNGKGKRKIIPFQLIIEREIA